MTKRREDRYQSAGELGRDLGNYLSGRPTMAGAAAPPRNWVKALPAAFAAIAAIVILGSGVAWWMQSRHNAPSAGVAIASTPGAAVVPAAPAVIPHPADPQPTRPAPARLPEAVWPASNPAAGTIPLFPGFDGPTTDPMSKTALVQHPAAIEGLKSWTIEGRDHRGQITAVAYSPDGKFLATAGSDRTVRLWDAANHQLVRIFVSHNSPIGELAWAPDSRSLASVQEGIGVRIWEIPSGRLIKRVTDSGSHARWSPDGHRLAAFFENRIRTYDTSTWNQVGMTGAFPFPASCFSWLADNVRVAIGTQQGGVYIGNTDSGEFVSLGQKRDLWIYEVSVSPDGTRLACTSSNNKDMVATEVWDLNSMTLLKARGAGPVQWSPSSKTLAIAPGHDCVEWNPDSGVTRQRELPGNTNYCISWAPDGQTLAAAAQFGQVQFLQTDNWSLAGLLSKEWNSDHSTVLSPEGSLITTCAFATQHEPRARLFTAFGDFISDAYLSQSASDVRLGFSTDATHLASGGMGIVLVDCHSGSPVGRLDDDHDNNHMTWRPHSSTIAATREADLMLWDATNRKVLKTIRAAGEIKALAWSIDGQTIAIGLGKNGIELRDSDGNLIRSIRDASADAQVVFWSPDGKMLGSTEGSGTCMWDVKTGQGGWTTSQYAGQAFSPDGKLMAGYSQNTAVVCDSQTGRVLQRFPLDGTFYEVEFNWIGPDTLAFSTRTGALRYCNARTGEPLGVLVTALPGSRVAIIGPKGRALLTGGAEKSIVYVTQTDAGQETLTPEEFRAKYHWKN